jgi:hypothetical protein
LSFSGGTTARSGRGSARVALEAGKEGAPHHCDSAEEEIVILERGGTGDLGDEQAPVRPGHVLGCPLGARVAHSSVRGMRGLTYLTDGTRETNDIAYHPDSGKANFRGIGLITRLERLDSGTPGLSGRRTGGLKLGELRPDAVSTELKSFRVRDCKRVLERFSGFSRTPCMPEHLAQAEVCLDRQLKVFGVDRARETVSRQRFALIRLPPLGQDHCSCGSPSDLRDDVFG